MSSLLDAILGNRFDPAERKTTLTLFFLSKSAVLIFSLVGFLFRIGACTVIPTEPDPPLLSTLIGVVSSFRADPVRGESGKTLINLRLGLTLSDTVKDQLRITVTTGIARRDIPNGVVPISDSIVKIHLAGSLIIDCIVPVLYFREGLKGRF